MPYKTHKITLDPTFKQRRWFSSQCGYARFAYNKGLEDFKAGLAQGNFQSWITLNNNFNQRKKGYDWTLAQDQRAALYAIMNLGQAIENWDDGRAKFPKFKGRGHKKRDLDLSERTYHCGRCGISIDRDVNAAINLRPITVG